MALYFSRFKKFPEALKIITLLLTLVLMFMLGSVKVHPPGVSMIWFTIAISIIFDISTIVLLLKEYDVTVMAVRMMPYAALECTCSVLIIVFYILSATLSISSEEITDDFGFILSAIFCFFIAMGYVANLTLNIQKWVNGVHLANDPNIYDYPSYGSD